MKILADFQICISVPLSVYMYWNGQLWHKRSIYFARKNVGAINKTFTLTTNFPNYIIKTCQYHLNYVQFIKRYKFIKLQSTRFV